MGLKEEEKERERAEREVEEEEMAQRTVPVFNILNKEAEHGRQEEREEEEGGSPGEAASADIDHAGKRGWPEVSSEESDSSSRVFPSNSPNQKSFLNVNLVTSSPKESSGLPHKKKTKSEQESVDIS